MVMSPAGAADLEARLARLESQVRLVIFTQTFGCDTCLLARQVVSRFAEASDYVSIEEYDLVIDTEKVTEFGVDRAPAIAFVGKTDLGIRYYGVPAGYELDSMIDAVLLAGSGAHALSADNLAQLETIDYPIDIKVFVTPT